MKRVSSKIVFAFIIICMIASFQACAKQAKQSDPVVIEESNLDALGEKLTDFAETCVDFTYADLLSNPGSFKEKNIRFICQVFDIVEAETGNIELTANLFEAEQLADNMLVISYPKNDTEREILEEEMIYVYGTIKEINTGDSENPIVHIEAKYIITE